MVCDEEDQDKAERAKARYDEWKGKHGSGNQEGAADDHGNDPTDDEPDIEDTAVRKRDGMSRPAEGYHLREYDSGLVPGSTDDHETIPAQVME